MGIDVALMSISVVFMTIIRYNFCRKNIEVLHARCFD